MFIKKSIYSILLCLLSTASCAVELGLHQAQAVNDSNLLSLTRSDAQYADVFSVIKPGESNLPIDAYMPYGPQRHYYVLVGDSADFIDYIDASSKSILSSVNISDESYSVLASELPSAASYIYDHGGDIGKYWENKAPDDIVSGTNFTFYDETSPGCLVRYPLLYGDVDGDDVTDLVVFRKNMLEIYSSKSNKVVFSEPWHTADLDTRPVDDSVSIAKTYRQLGNKAPQYLAGSSYDVVVYSPYPAWKAFAKIYFGDFDGDKVPDIIMWRKVYETNLLDQAKGFHLKAQRFLHYRLVNGVYVLQDTAQATIAGWMSANNLTWSSGYPDKSECKGQEGQPIPEMHDPLLNDPDVLK